MGAESFIHEIEGRSARECFEDLVEEANRIYGTASYNGSINTCSMGRKTLSLDKLNKTNIAKADKFIDESGNGEKWVANYIEIGPIYYEMYSVKKANTGAKPKYKLKYVVREESLYDPIKAFDTKKAADDYALSLAISNLDDSYFVNKEYYLISGKETVTEINVEIKKYKNKPKLKKMPNRKVAPIYKYIFYGWASC